MDSKSGYLLESLPKSEVEDLALEEVSNISYEAWSPRCSMRPSTSCHIVEHPPECCWMTWRCSTHCLVSLAELWMAGGDPAKAAGFADHSYAIGGHRLAHLTLKPAVVEFFETALRAGSDALNIEDLAVPPDSPAAGRTLDTLNIRRGTGATILLRVLTKLGDQQQRRRFRRPRRCGRRPNFFSPTYLTVITVPPGRGGHCRIHRDPEPAQHPRPLTRRKARRQQSIVDFPRYGEAVERRWRKE
jgi:hypothetical protein